LDAFLAARGAELHPARAVAGLALADDADLRRSPLAAAPPYAGAALLHHDAAPSLAWPLTQLAAGVVCGLVALAGLVGMLATARP
jgi:hypothetical protein